MKTITIKGREIPLIFTTWEMKQVAEEIAPINQAIHLILGRNGEDETDTSLYGTEKHLGAIGKMTVILGNAGLEETGKEPDLTLKWVMRALRPADLANTVTALVDALNEGMASEIPPKKKDGPVDVTLEEMQKKKEKDG